MKMIFKKNLVYLFGIFFSFSEPGWAQTPGELQVPDPNQGLFYIATKMDISIDGYLDEWHELTPIRLNSAEQAHYSQNDWGGENDCNVQLWLAWNENGIAIAAMTRDDSIAFPFAGSQSWRNDCIQVAFDVKDENAQNGYRTDDRSFIATYSDSQPRIYEQSDFEQRESGYRPYPCQIQVFDNLIVYEFLLPWEELGLVGPVPGRSLGFSFVAFDNDGQDARGWLEWTPGVARDKATLPFGNVLIFDARVNVLQAIPSQTFLSESDSISVWLYSRYSYLKYSISYRLLEGDETLFRGKMQLRGKKWTRLVISARYLKWGWLRLEIESGVNSPAFELAIWSREHITEQITYLAQQVQALKTVKGIAPSAPMLVQHWLDGLQSRFASARGDFEYFNLMISAQKQIDRIPNFYMEKPVFYNTEHRIVEGIYASALDHQVQRYFLYLPTQFQPGRCFPLFIFLSDVSQAEDENAIKIGAILAERDLPVIALFPHHWSQTGFNEPALAEIRHCLDQIQKIYCIDPNKIHLAGEGHGGELASLLALRSPDTFASLTAIDCLPDTGDWQLNLSFTPSWFFASDTSRLRQTRQVASQTPGIAHMVFTKIPDYGLEFGEDVFTPSYFDWLLGHSKATHLRDIDLWLEQGLPASAYWLEINGQKRYDIPGRILAVADSGRINIQTINIARFAVNFAKLPPGTKPPLTIDINSDFSFRFESDPGMAEFIEMEDGWKRRETQPVKLEKSFGRSGPMARLWNKPVRFVYSTSAKDKDFNQLTLNLAKAASQLGRGYWSEPLVLADSTVLKQAITTDLVIFGNTHSNALLQKMSAKLPVQVTDSGLKFGKSSYSSRGIAALYLFPNPLQPDYLVLVAIAPELSGMTNIQKWLASQEPEKTLDYDFFFFDSSTVAQSVWTGLERGYFDYQWRTTWFKPPFSLGPKRWFPSLLVGLDANQLSINSNWKGGGRGNFTWKTYFRFELKYQHKHYTWENNLYCAYGQISVQENKQWRAPEKSNDNIDFESVLRLTLKTYIDPYLATTLNTQFQEGRNPTTRALMSRFLNPLQASQSAGIAKRFFDRSQIQLTSRLGYAAKEFFVTDRKFRKIWTGDESRGRKIDGGIELVTEIKAKFTNNIQYNSKLKLFQALFSSISPEKDPEKRWRQPDIYGEQLLTAKFNQLIAFNLMMKFLYDRDTSSGGQFLESASLGISYKFN